MNERSGRIEWIDVMRGIAMIMVIYGHIDGNSHIGQFMYMFHVPAFFFISGYLFNPQLSIKEHIKKRVCRLLVPFILFGTTMILINWCVHIILGLQYDALHYIKDMIFQVRGTDSRIWFLPCLFLAECIMVIIFAIKNIYLRMTLFGLVILFGWLNIFLFHKDLPWYPDTAAVAISLMLIGYFLKSWKRNNLLLKCGTFVISAFVCISVYFFNLKFGYSIDMVMNHYGNVVLFYCGAISGIVLLMNISNILNVKLLKYIGKNTICFLCLNTIAIKIVEKGLSLLMMISQISSFHKIFVYPWIVTILVIVILIPSSYLINKFIPFYVGNMKCS